MDLEERVLQRAELLGVVLSAKELEKILKDIKRWTRRDLPPGKVRTEDGSLTLVDKRGEPFHSITAGAITECLEKFVRPSRIVERAKELGRVRILDVGFGLGYNVAIAVHEMRKVNPKIEVEILSLEKAFPNDIPLLPEPYREIHREILNLIPAGEREGVRINVLLGDGRGRVRELGKFCADAVFHDAFSPYKNPELWSFEFLREITKAMAKTGYWVSYTSSLPVRKALLLLGLRVGSSKPVGRKRGGTVASFKSPVPEMHQEEILKLESSPYSVLFRDPDLCGEPIDILIDYRINVLLRERELFSGSRREEPSRLP